MGGFTDISGFLLQILVVFSMVRRCMRSIIVSSNALVIFFYSKVVLCCRVELNLSRFTPAWYIVVVAVVSSPFFASLVMAFCVMLGPLYLWI